jgi:hypothetical protein
MTYEIELQIAGTYALDVYGYVVAVGSFNLYKGQLTIDDDTDNTTDGFAADVLTISVEVAHLFAGMGASLVPDPTGYAGFKLDTEGAVGFSVNVADGSDDPSNFYLAIVQNTATGDSYVGVEFELVKASLVGITGLTFEVGATVIINWAEQGLDRLNWAQAYANDTSDPKRLPEFSMDGGDEFLIGGFLALDVYGYVVTLGRFQLYKGQLTIDDDEDPTTDGFAADVLTISVEVAHLFAGMGASLVPDPTGYAGFKLDTEGAVGFSVNVEEGSDDPSNLYLAIVQNTTTGDSYIGVEFELVEASLVGITGLTFEVGATVMVNWAEEGLERLNWYQAAVNETGDRLPVFNEKLTSELNFLISGSMTLGLFDFFYASGSFALEKYSNEQVTVTDGVTSEAGVEVDMLTIGATVNHAFAGANGPYWVDIDDDGTQSWVLPDISDGRVVYPCGEGYGDLNGDGIVDADETADQSGQSWQLPDISDGRVVYVGPDGYGDLNGDGIVDADETADSEGQSWQLPDISDGRVVYLGQDGYGDLNGDEIVDGDETADPEGKRWLLPDISDGRIVQVEDQFYGDINGNNTVDADETAELNEEAVGLALSNVNFGLALMRTTAEDDLRTWTGVHAGVGDAGFVGIEDFKLSVRSLAVEINRGGGKTSTGDSNDTVVDFQASWDNNDNGEADPADGLELNTGNSTPVLLNFTSKILRARGAFTLVIDDYVFVNGAFALQKEATQTAILNDGTDTTPATETDVTYLTLGASSVDIFIGNGPYTFTDNDGDGDFDEDDNPDAIGIVLGNASLALALLRSSTHTYFALSAFVSTADFQGLDALEAILDFDISNVAVQVNGGNDGNRVVDFAKSDLDGNGDNKTRVKTGPGASDYIDFDFSEKLLQAAATVTLKIDDFVFIQGSLAFTYAPEQNVTLSNGSKTSVSVLAIAATDVNAFLGIGPYTFADNDDDGDFDEDDNPDAPPINTSP